MNKSISQAVQTCFLAAASASFCACNHKGEHTTLHDVWAHLLGRLRLIFGTHLRCRLWARCRFNCHTSLRVQSCSLNTRILVMRHAIVKYKEEASKNSFFLFKFFLSNSSACFLFCLQAYECSCEQGSYAGDDNKSSESMQE